MMRFVYLLLFIFFSGVCSAQESYFVYIQTESQQPFSVRIADKQLSSSASGYLIIPKLVRGEYRLNIDFPKNQWPAQKMLIDVTKDQGYVLKDFGSKGWGLFNLQTMNILMNENSMVNSAKDSANADGFADVLADVVGSPSIREKPKEKPVPEIKVQPKERVSETAQPEQKSNAAKMEVQVAKAEKPNIGYTAPVRINSFLDATGRSMVYVDTANAANDTIRVFIPYPEVKNEEKPGQIKAPKSEPPKVADQISPAKNTIPEKEAVTTETTKKEEVKLVPAPEKAMLMINSDCKGQADDRDFLKLRKKMAAQQSEENMVIIALKDFGKRCYTTEQIEHLSVLFLSEKGRYNFFDAAYPYVSDTGNFPKLVSKLTDEYYINRFKAMIRR